MWLSGWRLELIMEAGGENTFPGILGWKLSGARGGGSWYYCSSLGNCQEQPEKPGNDSHPQKAPGYMGSAQCIRLVIIKNKWVFGQDTTKRRDLKAQTLLKPTQTHNITGHWCFWLWWMLYPLEKQFILHTVLETESPALGKEPTVFASGQC